MMEQTDFTILEINMELYFQKIQIVRTWDGLKQWI
jgi:hypothetical protein